MNRPRLGPASAAWLHQWAFINAVVLASSTIYALLRREFAATVPAAAASFALLFGTAFYRLGARSLLHAANFITFLRLTAVLSLSVFGVSAAGAVVIVAGTALLLGDCLDGWVAERSGRRSEFGEFFDKETDAFWLLTLCLLALRKGFLPFWIVGLGLMRYLFVIAIFVFKSNSAREERSGRGRLIYTGVMLILLAAFLPYPMIRLPLSIVAAVLLTTSFAVDSARVFGFSGGAGTGPGTDRTWRRVETVRVRQKSDIAAFFDRLAPEYKETHGPHDRLLQYRLSLIRELGGDPEDALILELGCGRAEHLLRLVGGRRRGLGVDISAAMVHEAKETARRRGFSDAVSFRVDDAEYLSTVADSSVDLAYCVGSFEHFLDKGAALNSVFRVLKTEARFVCLTPNGASLYYRWLSPLLRLPARHLSTDGFVTSAQAGGLLSRAGFRCCRFGYWSFIPRGDMPPAVGFALRVLDAVGRAARVPFFRGGLYFVGIKP